MPVKKIIAKFPYKLYPLILTLIVFVFALAFIPVMAQESRPQSAISKTQKRLNGLVKYQSNLARFNNLKGTKYQPALDKYSKDLNNFVTSGNKCREGLDSQTSQQRKDCDKIITAGFKTTKQTYRLLKYYQIDLKVPFICVKADLGVGTPLEARGISNPEIFATASAGQKETGRTGLSQVFLCTGENGQRKLRVQGANGRYFKLTPDDLKKPELNLSNLPPKTSLDDLTQKLGL